jgi:hypothetical protein
MSDVAARNGTTHGLRTSMGTGGLWSLVEINTFCLPNPIYLEQRNTVNAATGAA